MHVTIKYASGNIFLIIQQFLLYDIALHRVLDNLESIVVILLNVKYCFILKAVQTLMKNYYIAQHC